MLKLKSSARANRRYLLIEAKSRDEIEKTILEYIGILGWAKAAPVFIDSPRHNILAVNREALSHVRAAFEVSQKNIKVIKVSGTLKGLEK